MPDITISLTDAQWTRVVAASQYIAGLGNGDVTVDYLATRWKEQLSEWVKAYEEQQASTDDF